MPKTVDGLAHDIRSKVAQDVKSNVLVQELRIEGSKAAAALKLVLWQVHGEIAAAKLGDPSTLGMSRLKRQRLLLLEIHASVSPLTHASLQDALRRADQQSKVRNIACRIAIEPAARRTHADFSQLINMYRRIGGFPSSQQQGSKSTRQAVKQKPDKARPQIRARQAEAGVSAFRTSVKVST